jgi:hypothetical protein
MDIPNFLSPETKAATTTSSSSGQAAAAASTFESSAMAAAITPTEDELLTLQDKKNNDTATPAEDKWVCPSCYYPDNNNDSDICNMCTKTCHSSMSLTANCTGTYLFAPTPSNKSYAATAAAATSTNMAAAGAKFEMEMVSYCCYYYIIIISYSVYIFIGLFSLSLILILADAPCKCNNAKSKEESVVSQCKGKKDGAHLISRSEHLRNNDKKKAEAVEVSPLYYVIIIIIIIRSESVDVESDVESLEAFPPKQNKNSDNDDDLLRRAALWWCGDEDGQSSDKSTKAATASRNNDGGKDHHPAKLLHEDCAELLDEDGVNNNDDDNNDGGGGNNVVSRDELGTGRTARSRNSRSDWRRGRRGIHGAGVNTHCNQSTNGEGGVEHLRSLSSVTANNSTVRGGRGRTRSSSTTAADAENGPTTRGTRKRSRPSATTAANATATATDTASATSTAAAASTVMEFEDGSVDENTNSSSSNDEDNAATSDTSELVEMNDFFADTGFNTSRNKDYSLAFLQSIMNDSTKIRQIIEEDYGGPLLSHPITGESRILCGILTFLLKNGDIKSIASKAKTDKSPAMSRSELSIHGTAEQIIDSHPEGYDIVATPYGRKVLEQLRRAIALNDNEVGADGSLGKLYALLWKLLAPAQKKVGADGEKAEKDESALALGYHCDQTAKTDPTHDTNRAVNAFGKDFNVDRKLVVVWIDKEGKKHTKTIGTISDKVEGNQTYYFTHRGSGRAAIGQTLWDGCPAVLVVMHQVWLDAVHKNCPRGIYVEDRIFSSAELEDRFMAMVDPSNNTINLPENFNNITMLFNDLVKDKPELLEFVKGANFSNDVLAVINSNNPTANDYNIQCCNLLCSRNASALDLRRHRGRDDNLSRAKLLQHLRDNCSKEDIINNRAICETCANRITNKAEVVTNLCLKCCLNSKVGKLAQCGDCRDYRCVGYNDGNGNRSFECGDVGIKLDNSNISSSGAYRYSICKKCTNAIKRLNRQAETSKKRTETNQDEQDVIELGRIRNMFELYDADFRSREENKQYIRGEQSVNWDAVSHATTGYDYLKRCDSKKMKLKFANFKTKHPSIKSLEDFNEYIQNGGKVGHAARVQNGKMASGKKGQKNRR